MKGIELDLPGFIVPRLNVQGILGDPLPQDLSWNPAHSSGNHPVRRTRSDFGLTHYVCLEPVCRAEAIRNMRNIYRSAARVLVLDSFIQAIPRSVDVTEKYVRIWISNWHRRLWTLQEGLLGQALLFQFKDGAVTICDMDKEVADYADYGKTSVRHLYSSVRLSCAMTLDPFYDLFHVLGSRASEGFLTWAYGIRGRSTSYIEDEPICFANILGLDPGPMLQLSESDMAPGESLAQRRMERFYELVRDFDARIIFNEFP